MARVTILALATGLLLLPAFSAQDPQEDLKKENERLKQQLETLNKECDRLQRAVEESAQEIVRLRAMIKQIQSQPVVEKPREADPQNPTLPVGPAKPIVGKVMAVDPKFNFVLVNLGELDGVKPGYRFEIVRRDDKGAMRRIAVAEFDKFIGESKAQSKLKVVEGIAGDIKFEDEALAFRNMDPAKTDLPTPKQPEQPTTGPKKFVIKGFNGETLWLNYGTQDGAKQTDVVYVYRENRLRAKLRLEQVDKDWSAAKIIDGSKIGEVNMGDEISLKEIKTSAIGTVKFNDERRGMVIDLGSEAGRVKTGQKFEVRRSGRKIGEITLKTVEKFWSYADPAGETKRDEIQVGDVVESID
jgi:hypothetical protein